MAGVVSNEPDDAEGLGASARSDYSQEVLFMREAPDQDGAGAYCITAISGGG